MSAVDLDGTAHLSSSCAQAYRLIADLATYPEWLGIVRRAETAAAHPDDAGPAWTVELGARIGPLWRTKRVRMVRTVADEPAGVRFERVEHDGRSHSAWVLGGSLTGDGDGPGCRLDMHLHYGGARRLPFVDLVLREEIRKAGARLDALLRAGS